MSQRIIFYDGHCFMCNGFVRWLIKRDQKDLLRFAPLQSPVAKRYQVPADANSVVYFDGDRQYKASDAALQILKALPYPWKALYHLRFIPKKMRDAIYAFVANNRYRWFGRSETCQMPDKSIRDKFLDQF